MNNFDKKYNFDKIGTNEKLKFIIKHYNMHFYKFYSTLTLVQYEINNCSKVNKYPKFIIDRLYTIIQSDMISSCFNKHVEAISNFYRVEDYTQLYNTYKNTLFSIRYIDDTSTISQLKYITTSYIK